MKTILFLLALFSVSAYATTAKQACDELKPVVKDLQAQAPMDIDYVTTLTGVQVFYVSNICILNYSYVLKTTKFLDDMAKQNELSIDENLAFLKTEDGVAALQGSFDDIAKNSANTNFKDFKEIKGMHILYSYSFDDTEVPTIRATVMENEL
mgnify:CR=1 FL=1